MLQQLQSRKRARSPALDDQTRRRLVTHLEAELGDTLPMPAYLSVLDGSYERVPMENRQKIAQVCERLSADLRLLAAKVLQ